MDARGIGVITGVIVGIILCFVIFRLCNKNKKLKSEYDERQEVIRGRAFKYGFYTALIYMGIITMIYMTGLDIPIGNMILNFCGIILSVSVMAIYSIWNDAYWGINNNRTRYIIIFIIATAINLLVGVTAIFEGKIIIDGEIQAEGVNLLCAVMFLVIAIALLIKKASNKTDTEEE